MTLSETGTIVLMLARGMLNNIGLWFISGVLSLCGGILLGCLSHAHIRTRFLTIPIRIYVVVMRSIPLYVHILYIYFVVPQLIGINLSPWMAALLALVVCVTAYCTEVIRAAINALPIGQWEAAQVLDYSYWQTIRYVIGPQAIRIAVPSLMNLSEELIKGTAIVSVVGVMDITRTGMNIIARTMQPELVYTLIACLYFLLSILVHGLLSKVTRYFYGTV